ncbi:hypothetical protein [Nocardia sp. bgisy134]|uniref:hypothetical protein n=1 Tax=Nocardia sp. bgisy134 TaxID=3413789 RepID=UPI003D731F67
MPDYLMRLAARAFGEPGSSLVVPRVPFRYESGYEGCIAPEDIDHDPDESSPVARLPLGVPSAPNDSPTVPWALNLAPSDPTVSARDEFAAKPQISETAPDSNCISRTVPAETPMPEAPPLSDLPCSAEDLASQQRIQTPGAPTHQRADASALVGHEPSSQVPVQVEPRTFVDAVAWLTGEEDIRSTISKPVPTKQNRNTAPVVRVTIGRIDVRAASPVSAEPPKPPPKPPKASGGELSAYLRGDLRARSR